MTAKRVTLGRVSFKRVSRLPDVSAVTSKVNPVMLPPGRARLEANPALTGFVAVTVTMGTVDVAFWAAAVTLFRDVTMTSGLSRTSS
jgi:hypothetical protein